MAMENGNDSFITEGNYPSRLAVGLLYWGGWDRCGEEETKGNLEFREKKRVGTAGTIGADGMVGLSKSDS